MGRWDVGSWFDNMLVVGSITFDLLLDVGGVWIVDSCCG